jgi:hypothetical protein
VTRRSLIGMLVLLLTLSMAGAQQPLKPPAYDLATSPTLAVGGSATGELSRDDGRDFINGGYLDIWAIPSDGNEVLEVRIAARGGMIFFGSLFSPAGEVVDYRSDTTYQGDTNVTSVVARVGAPGVYMLVVSGYGPDTLGAYTLERVSHQAGEGTTVAISVPGQFSRNLPYFAVDRLEFTLTEATTVVATLQADGFNGFLGLGGAQDNYNYGFAQAYFGEQGELRVRLEPGRYAIAVNAAEGVGSGTYRVDLQVYEPPVVEAIDVMGPSFYTGELAPGTKATYRIVLNSDSRLRVRVSSFAFDTYLEIFEASSNFLIAENDDDVATDSYLDVGISAGTYLVVVSSVFAGEGGSFELNLDW